MSNSEGPFETRYGGRGREEALILCSFYGKFLKKYMAIVEKEKKLCYNNPNGYWVFIHSFDKNLTMWERREKGAFVEGRKRQFGRSQS